MRTLSLFPLLFCLQLLLSGKGSRANVTSIEVKDDLQLDSSSVMEQSTVYIICNATGVPTPKITMRKESDSGAKELKGEVTQISSDKVTFKYTIVKVSCEDFGVYTCVSYVCGRDPDSDFILLQVKTPVRHPYGLPGRPQFNPREMTRDGVSIELEAYPPPQHFTYTFHGKNKKEEPARSPPAITFLETSTETNSSCRVTVYILGQSVPQHLLGVYRVTISNGLGSVDDYFVVKEVLSATSLARIEPKAVSSDGVMAGILIGIVALVVVVIYVRWKRDAPI